jgi:hypothetical protein
LDAILQEPFESVLRAIGKFTLAKSALGEFTEDDAGALREFGVNIGFIWAGLDDLTERGFLERQDRGGGPVWRFTRLGTQVVHGFENEASPSSRIFPNAVEDEPAIVLFNRDSEEGRAAIRAAQEVLDRVRGDNQFASDNPDQHAALVGNISLGLESLRKYTPTRQVIRSLLGGAFRWTATNFANAEIKELAARAAKHLSPWM